MTATATETKRVAYYKGCLASLSAKELDSATQALAPKVGLELVELESVTCCGAGDIHEAEPDYYLHLNARILSYAAAEGVDTLLTVCNVCTLNLRQANFILLGDKEVRARINENLVAVGVPAYERDVDVRHLLWEVAEGAGYEKLKVAAHRGLRGLKIAPFYGCQILRPSKIQGFEDPDRPWSLERIIEACGGEAIDYPAKIKCCGFPIIQAREETALGELIQPIEQAKEAGADAIVTPCPLCHLSLDAWQSKLKAQTGKDYADADPAPLAADRRRRGPRGVRAEVQAARRLGQADPREARDLTLLVVVAGLLALAAAGLAWGWFEAGWVRLRVLEVPVPGLPPELDGLRIAHLSDFHLGVPSRGLRAVRRAVAWVASRAARSRLHHRRPALARERPGRARPAARSASAPVRRARQPRLRDLARPVLAAGRDRRPDARDAALRLGRRASTCAGAASSSRASTRARGSRDSQVEFPESQADLRILLCHFPAALVPGRAGPVPPRPRRPSARAARSCCRTASAACCSRIRGCATRRGSSCAAARCMHVSPVSGRRSSRFASSRAPRRPNSFYDPPDGRSQRHLARRPRAVRRRRGARGSRRARGVRDAAPAARREGRRRRGRGAPARRLRRRSSPTSRLRCRRASPTTCCAWPTFARRR